MLKKDEALAAMKKRLDELSAEIDALEARAHEVKEEARAKFQEQLVALRANRQEGEKKLEEMKSATEGSWNRLKTESDKVWDAWRDSLSAFKASVISAILGVLYIRIISTKTPRNTQFDTKNGAN